MGERYTITLEIPQQHDLEQVEVALDARLNRDGSAGSSNDRPRVQGALVRG